MTPKQRKFCDESNVCVTRRAGIDFHSHSNHFAYLEKKQSVKHWSGNSIVYGFDADGLLTTPSAFFFGILLRITKTGTDKIGD